jgi:hypothetical protein
MTAEQEVRLIREILQQLLAGRLTGHEAMTAIGLVLNPGALTYAEVAFEVRCRIARLSD